MGVLAALVPVGVLAALVAELPVAEGARGFPGHLEAIRLQRVARAWSSRSSGYSVDRSSDRQRWVSAATLVGLEVAVGVLQPALRQSVVFHELQPPAGCWGSDR